VLEQFLEVELAPGERLAVLGVEVERLTLLVRVERVPGSLIRTVCIARSTSRQQKRAGRPALPVYHRRARRRACYIFQP
jgi:hypothetical protein